MADSNRTGGVNLSGKDIKIGGSLSGRDYISSDEPDGDARDVSDIVAAKLRAKQLEAEAEGEASAAEALAKAKLVDAIADRARTGSGELHIGQIGDAHTTTTTTNFGNVGGSVITGNVGGNVDASMHTTTTSTSGITADDVAKLFDSLYKRIESKPKEDQPAIKDAVDTIKQAAQAEAVEGKAPDEKAVTAAAKSLAVDAPDLLTDAADVALATLANPAAGVIMLIRKIAEKAKASRAG